MLHTKSLYLVEMVVAKKGERHKTLRGKFCSCIKKVRRTVKVRGRRRPTTRNRESAAIGICVKSVLGTRGKTLHHFTCKDKQTLKTQAPIGTQ